MSGIVFIAVIGAALLHATWNALVKSGDDKILSMSAVVIGHLPIALALLPFVPFPSSESLPYLFAGIALHSGYHIFLIKSYQIADLTHVYPIARGSAPLLVTLFSITVLGVHLAGLEILAVVIIGVGIISLALVRHHEGQSSDNNSIKAAIFALITGVFIATYSIVDGMGARIAGSSIGFYSWLAVGDGVLTIGFLMFYSRPTLYRLPTRGLRTMIFGGSASFIAYTLVTWAFTQAPIALVTALRETSIIFVLLIGVFFLKERLNLLKLLSIMCTLLGAILLRFVK